MKIITISREFGSGGRELGKRLADVLGVPCYDHEIIDMVAEKHGFDKNYVSHISEKDIRMFYPSTIGTRFMNPLNMFVYADRPSKLQRCKDRADKNEHISEKEIFCRMKQIDKERAAYRKLFTDEKWGRKEFYHLCINTSGKKIKMLIPAVAAYVNAWFEMN